MKNQTIKAMVFIRVFTLIGLLGLVGMMATMTPAQQTSILRGQVVDEQGAVIPGAKVTVINSATKKQQTVTSNALGEFSLSGLAAGVYTVLAEYEGFQPFSNTAVRVPLATPLQAILKVAGVTIVTDVALDSKTVSVEPDENLSATVLDEEFVRNNLPDNEEDLRQYLNGLAGPAGGGASGGQGGAQILVDGFSGGRLPPREAIFQIRVNQNPFTAEFSNPGFGRIEIVTKPGNDRWRGNVQFNMRNSDLDARNAFALIKPDVRQERYGFNIGGPLIAKRMSFFANYEDRTLTGGNTVVATTLKGQEIYNVEAPSGNRNFTSRVDYLINQKNTLNLSYSYFYSESLNLEFAVRFGGFGGGFGGGGGGGFGGGGFGGGFGGGGAGGGTFTLLERGSDSNSSNHNLRLSETFIVSTTLLMESRLQWERQNSQAKARTTGVAINVLDAFNGGGATCCPSDSTTSQIEWQQYLTWTQKKHTVKFGWQLQREAVDDFSANNFNGTYTFSNLEQYRRVLNGDPTARPQQYTVNRGNPALNYAITQNSWFFNDDWRVNQKMTLSFGLRHEFQTQLVDKLNLAPRFGLAWSPFRDRKTTFRFGGGIFYSRLASNLYESILRFDGVTQQSILIRNPLYPDPFAGNPNVQISNTVKRVFEPDMKAPYTVNYSLTVERQLPKGLNGSFTYIYARGVHQFRTRNINAPLPGTYDPTIPNSGVRPLGDVGNIYQIESSANSKYNGLLFRLDRRMGRNLNLFGNYTLSWTKSDADGSGSLPANNYDLTSEWGRAFTDRRHSFFVGGRIGLPLAINLSPFINASSGGPFSITTGFDENGDTVINDRPLGLSRNTSLPVGLYGNVTNRCISNCAPGSTAQVLLRDYLFANFPKGVTAESPGSFNVNMNVSKTFSFGERKNAQAQQGGGMGPMMGGMGRMGGGPMGFGNESGRFNLTVSAQISNVLNRVNLGGFSGVLGSPYFMRSSSAGGARQFELGLRFSF
ncbi:MAG: carboxypeptidase regulatory-like domain-containing protein [Acidobacteriota bacterium]